MDYGGLVHGGSSGVLVTCLIAYYSPFAPFFEYKRVVNDIRMNMPITTLKSEPRVHISYK
jgi:hypothetical protein